MSNSRLHSKDLKLYEKRLAKTLLLGEAIQSCFQDKCFSKFCIIRKKAPIQESLCNKVAGLLPESSLKRDRGADVIL